MPSLQTLSFKIIKISKKCMTVLIFLNGVFSNKILLENLILRNMYKCLESLIQSMRNSHHLISCNAFFSRKYTL